MTLLFVSSIKFFIQSWDEAFVLFLNWIRQLSISLQTTPLRRIILLIQECFQHIPVETSDHSWIIQWVDSQNRVNELQLLFKKSSFFRGSLICMNSWVAVELIGLIIAHFKLLSILKQAFSWSCTKHEWKLNIFLCLWHYVLTETVPPYLLSVLLSNSIVISWELSWSFFPFLHAYILSQVLRYSMPLLYAKISSAGRIWTLSIEISGNCGENFF